MALITADMLIKLEKEEPKVHKPLGGDAIYFAFEKDGDKYFQINTYGSAERKVIDNISQTIQFDRDAAIRLVNILIEEFNLIPVVNFKR